MKSITTVILRLNLPIRSFENFCDIQIKNMFLLCSFKQKIIVFIYPCILDTIFIDSVIIDWTYCHKYKIGIRSHLSNFIYKRYKCIPIMRFTGIIDTVYSQNNIDNRRLVRFQIGF